jgi:hypothetical protein
VHEAEGDGDLKREAADGDVTDARSTPKVSQNCTAEILFKSSVSDSSLGVPKL